MNNPFRISISVLCPLIIAAILIGCTAVPTTPLEETESTTTPTTTPTTTSTSTTTSTTATTTTTAKTTTTTKTTKTTSTNGTATTKRPNNKHKQLSVPIMHQFPDYPTGCESVSAVMALNYWNEKITVDQFIDDYLPKNAHFYRKNNGYYGPSPYEYFIGDPRSKNSYGCMAPVIEKALNHYFGDNDRVVNTTGMTLSELCDTYISQDVPVLVWTTIGMVETYSSDQWLLEDGTLFEWPANEHCMVLVGYDENYYYFNDPYRGAVKKYAKWLCEQRYAQLGKQSLVITE